MPEQAGVCYVVMPFGTKPDGMGGTIDFDLVYRSLLAPAIAGAGMTAARADQDVVSGALLHKANLEWVIGANVTLFDVTTTNANVLYELGIRHAMRPRTTIVVAERGTRIPWDLNNLRVLQYALNTAGRPENPEQFHQLFSERARLLLRDEGPDSPVYAFFDALNPPDIESVGIQGPTIMSTEGDSLRRRIKEARRLGAEELGELERDLGDLSRVSPEVLLTLFDAYRARGAWDRMIALVDRMPAATATSTKVQEQLALAFHRSGNPDSAEQILHDLLRRKGPSSETYGVLGRIYKDQWQKALAEGRPARASGLLKKAVDSYLHGFEADWRDVYPGLNALTLMEMLDQPDPRRDEVLPVVAYGLKRRLEGSRTEYWDFATLLELNVLARNPPEARTALTRVLEEARSPFELESTARNLKLIRERWEQRGEEATWVAHIERELATAK